MGGLHIQLDLRALGLFQLLGGGVNLIRQLGELHLVVHHRDDSGKDHAKTQHRCGPPQGVHPGLPVLFQLPLGQLHHVFTGFLVGFLLGLRHTLGVVPLGDVFHYTAFLKQGKIVCF